MSHARRALSRPSSTSRSRRRQSSHIQRRNLRVEPLEVRAVMDGDAIANPFHNSWFPTDVNFDYSVTPLDALLIVNELNAGGARELVLNGAGGANGEQGVSSLVDVSGDGMLTPLDALLVLNHLNGNGQGPAVISYQMQIVGADGNPLPEIAGQPGHFQVQKGQAFGVRVSVRDNRPESTISTVINGNTYFPYDQFPFGVSTTYADLHFNPSLVDLGAPNIQTVRLAGYGQAANNDTNGGTMVINVPQIGSTAAINLQRPGIVNIPGIGNITISAESARQGNRGRIQTALDDLLGVGNARVQNNGANDDYRIVFTGQLTNSNFDITAPVTNSFSGTSTVNRVFDPTNLELTDRDDMIAALNYNLFQNYNVFPNFKRLYGTLPESGGRVFEVLQEVSPTEWVISTLGGTSLSSSAGGDIDVNLTPGPNFDDETDYEREKADLPNGYFTIATPYFIASDVGTSQFNVSAPGNDASINSSAQSLLVVSELPTDPTTGQPVSGQPFTVVSWANIEIPTPLFVVVSADVTAVNDPVTINEGAGATTIDVLKIGSPDGTIGKDTNNVGPDEDLVVTGVGTAANQGPFATSKGSVSIVGGQVVYTPNENEFGTDSFTYFINNGDPNATDSATVLITITEINDDPVAVDDGPLTTPEDVMLSITLASLLDNDTSGPDPEGTPPAGDALAISTTPGAAVNGTVVYNAGTQSFEFTPSTDYSGPASFTYTLTDGRGGTATATVSINVTARNDAPTIDQPTNPAAIPEDDGPQTISDFVTGFAPGPVTATDEVGQSLAEYIVTVVSTTGAVLPVGTNFFSAGPVIDNAGTLTFTVNDNVWGTATVEVRARDNGLTANGGQDTSAPRTFVITVDPVNDAPTFTLLGNQQVNEGAGLSTVNGFVSSRGPGVLDPADTVTVEITNVVADPTLTFATPPTLSPTGTLTFQADTNAFGTATVTVTATDTGSGDNTSTQTFTITVIEVNDPPIANPDTAAVPDGSGNNGVDPFEVDVLSTDSSGVDAGAPNEVLVIDSFSVVGGLPPEVQIVNAGDRLLISTDLGYFDRPGFEVPDLVVNYTIRDRATAGQGLTATSTVTLSFIPNRLPFAADDTINGVVQEDQENVLLNPLVNDRSVMFNVADLRIIGISLTDLPGDDDTGWITDTITGAGGLSISIASDGTTDGTRILFTPADDFFGPFTFYYRVDDVVNGGETAYEGPDVGRITVNVAAVNDEPSFTLIAEPDQSNLEDEGAGQPIVVDDFVQSFNPGPANESSQTPTYVVSNNNPDLFDVAPAIAQDGTLTYTLKQDAFGSATVTVFVRDSGGTDNGGINESPSQEFTINVASVNDAPEFTKGPDIVVDEDQNNGIHSFPAWATGINTGADNEDQVLNFEIVSVVLTGGGDPASLLTGGTVSLSDTGALSFETIDDAFGEATVTIRLVDDGGTDNGGVDTSATQSFKITVRSVNDAPSFTKGPDVEVDEDENSGVHSFPGWVQASSAGPANESSQIVSYEIVSVVLSGVHNPVSGGGLFVSGSGPAIDNNGVLSFTTAPDAYGQATVTVRARDNGGTANGGVDASPTQTFTISVTPVNDPPPAVDDGPFQVFKSGDPALFDVLDNDEPNVDPNEVLTITNATITSPASFPDGTAPTVTVQNNQLLFSPNPDGFVGTVEVTYTVSDGNGGTNTAIATFEILDFVPGSISGIIWADVDDDGGVDPAVTPYGPERRLAEIEVYLVGTTMFGDSVSTMTRTNHLGAYTFANLVPGNYTVSLDNPATGSMVENVELFIDGKDNINGSNSVTTASGSAHRMSNNTFAVTFNELGLDVTNLNFGMLGLQAKYVNIRDHLANSTTNGAVFGANLGMPSDSQMYWYSMYDGWNGMHSLKITLTSDLTSATIQARDANNTLHSTTLSFTNDWMKIRIMGREGNNVVVRLVGTVSDFFPTADLIGDEVAASEPGMYAEGEGAEYAAAADEVFNGEAWA